jgi:transporter family protein
MESPMNKKDHHMSAWFVYALGAALLYGLHQVFTKLAAEHISDGLGGFVVEASAALTILVYLALLKLSGHWTQTSSTPGVLYSVATGVCVGIGTILFFLLFQRGGPLSAVPMVLAGGMALMAVAGILFFKEPISWPRLLGIVLSLVALFLLRAGPKA